MFKVIIIDNYEKYFVKNYKQFLFGGGVVDFTNNESEAAILPEIIAREIASGLREYEKNIMIKRVK